MKIEWNKITWYSKILAVILFVLTFYLGFVLGGERKAIVDDYKYSSNLQNNITKNPPIKKYEDAQDKTGFVFIKDITTKDKEYYVTFDFVTALQNPNYSNYEFKDINDLGTFEFDPNAKIQLIRYKDDIAEWPIVSSAELYQILKNNGEDYYALMFENDKSISGPYYLSYASPFSVIIKNGKIIELKQIYQE